MTETVSLAAVFTAAPRLAFGIGPDGTYTRSGQIAAFVLSLLAMFVFLPLVVVAALLYTRAETVYLDNPPRARTLVNWSWICLTAPVVIAVLAAPVIIALSI